MPEFVCIQDCYIAHGGARHCHYYQGEVHFFKECPPYFKELGSWTVDFESDTLEVLMKSDGWTGKEAAEWLKQKYRKEVLLPMPKRQLVDTIIDTRERSIQIPKDD